MSHEPAEPVPPPASVSAAPAVGSWLQTACTHGQIHGSPGPTWLVAIQTAAVPALSGFATGWPAETALGLRYAGWSFQARAAGDAACGSKTDLFSISSSSFLTRFRTFYHKSCLFHFSSFYTLPCCSFSSLG